MPPATPATSRRRLSSGLIDPLVALVAAVLAGGAAIQYGVQHDRPLTVVLGVVMIAPLVVRRSRPLAALAIILAAGIALPRSVPFELAAVVVLYAIAATRGWQAAVAASAAVVLARVVEVAAWGHAPNLADVFSPAIECAAAVAYGLYQGARRSAMDALVERAERLDRERELLAQRAVAEERVRIARELHDIVAHTVSLIVVQAQALGATSGSDDVRHATDGIADLGRQAMTEMHRTLALLRAGEDDAAELAPQPGLGGLDALIEQSRAGGLDVTVEIRGRPRALVQTLDLSAYRIVQEALTNVLKHAGATDARVTVAYEPHALALTIADAGAREAPAAAGARRTNGYAGGHGLVGMRERVALFGGTVTARPGEDRGFVVDAVLPYPRA